MQLHPQDYIKIDFHFETMKLKPDCIQGDKSSKLSQKMTYHNDLFYLFSQNLPQFPEYSLSLQHKLEQTNG